MEECVDHSGWQRSVAESRYWEGGGGGGGGGGSGGFSGVNKGGKEGEGEE